MRTSGRGPGAITAIYLVACAASIVTYLGVLGGWIGNPHDPHEAAYAIALALPWSLVVGMILHPDMPLGLGIVIASHLLNAGLLFHLVRFLVRRLAVLNCRS